MPLPRRLGCPSLAFPLQRYKSAACEITRPLPLPHSSGPVMQQASSGPQGYFPGCSSVLGPVAASLAHHTQDANGGALVGGDALAAAVGVPFPKCAQQQAASPGPWARQSRQAGSAYCSRLDLLLSPVLDFTASWASPDSVDFRELLGLTVPLRVPWGLARPFFCSWGLDWVEEAFLPIDGLLEPLDFTGCCTASRVFRPRISQ